MKNDVISNIIVSTNVLMRWQKLCDDIAIRIFRGRYDVSNVEDEVMVLTSTGLQISSKMMLIKNGMSIPFLVTMDIDAADWRWKDHNFSAN